MAEGKKGRSSKQPDEVADDATPTPDGTMSADSGKPADGGPTADDVFALYVARGFHVRHAAKKAGMGERTAYRRSREPAFRERVNELRAQIIADGVGVLARSMKKAARRLAELMDSGNEPVALGAAKAVLSMAIEGHERLSLDQRLAAIEASLNAAADGNRLAGRP